MRNRLVPVVEPGINDRQGIRGGLWRAGASVESVVRDRRPTWALTATAARRVSVRPFSSRVSAHLSVVACGAPGTPATANRSHRRFAPGGEIIEDVIKEDAEGQGSRPEIVFSGGRKPKRLQRCEQLWAAQPSAFDRQSGSLMAGPTAATRSAESHLRPREGE